MSSIGGKIRIGFYGYAVATVALALIAYAGLRFLEQGMEQGVEVSGFLDAVLEMRRFEKNLFLYANPDDRAEALAYVDKAEQLLTDGRESFVRFAGLAQTKALGETLMRYRRLLSEHGTSGGAADEARMALEDAIRKAGHTLAERAETIAQAQRAHLVNVVNRTRVALAISVTVVAVLAVLIARLLSRAAVHPLRRLERDLREIGQGRFDHVDPTSNDREIVSVTRAVNRMLGEIEARRRHLVQSEKLASLGTLVSGVAHELNNPLSNISTSCQIVLEELEKTGCEPLRDWLQQIDNETERARLIVRALLEFAREGSFKKRPVSLKSVIEKSLLLAGRKLDRQGQVHIDVADDLIVSADPQRLQQVCVNLIQNALDAGGAGVAIRFSASVEDGAAFRLPEDAVFGQGARPTVASDAVVVLRVDDNGPGIPQDVLPKVFDPFFTTKDVGHGSGLGLFITQELVHQHDGFIGVSSTPGAGTHFIICLPHERPGGGA